MSSGKWRPFCIVLNVLISMEGVWIGYLRRSMTDKSCDSPAKVLFATTVYFVQQLRNIRKFVLLILWAEKAAASLYREVK